MTTIKNARTHIAAILALVGTDLWARFEAEAVSRLGADWSIVESAMDQLKALVAEGREPTTMELIEAGLPVVQELLEWSSKGDRELDEEFGEWLRKRYSFDPRWGEEVDAAVEAWAVAKEAEEAAKA